MSINIVIGNRESVPFRIESHGGALKLPAIFVEPANANHPAVWIKAIRVRLVGDPLGVAVLGPAYAHTAELKVFDKPHKLTQRIECLPYATNLTTQEFPSGQYLMRVEVVYQLPAAFPGGPLGAKAVAFTERYLDVPGDLEAGCRLHAEWAHQELTVGVNVAELIIHVENLPRGAAPVISVFDPNGVMIPALRAAIDHQLSVSGPELLREQKKPNLAIFDQKISFRFDVPERAAAIRQAPIAVELRLSVKRADGDDPTDLAAFADLTGKQALIVEFPENMFPGYPILDLGTSSTFALIYFFQLQTGLLPVEQEQMVRASLNRWLDSKEGPFGMPEWQTVLSNMARQLGETERGGDPAASVRNYLKRNPPRPFHTDQGIHRALKALELNAMTPNLSVPFRAGLRRELAGMYARAFRRFPLQQQRLLAVELDGAARAETDPDLEGAIVAPIPSTTAVTSIMPFAVDIGHAAEAARQAAGVANPASLVTQFHSSPKNYYSLLGHDGVRVPVSVNGVVDAVKPRTFLVASLKRLRERIEAFRDAAEHLPKKRFSKIVMPFPTSAPLSVRQELLTAAREAGFDRPIADLDEALSAIVFYLVNPFGADLEMGLEAFRTNCRPIPRGGKPPIEWKQNVLLIDVGGGTTDIALIEVRLEDAQAKRAGDGSKGRYYRLTPKLLGATGRGQLAGNVLSLGVFHEVKRRIVDAVLRAVNPGPLAAAAPARPDAAAAAVPAKPAQAAQESANLERLLQASAKVPDRFKDETGRYRAGALLDHYLIHQLWLDKGDPLAPSAFRLANEVLPTAWKSGVNEPTRSAAARSFHLLWQIAESIKIDVFGGKSMESADRAIVPLEKIAALLGISVAACKQLGIEPVTIERQDFWASIDLPLREIAKLALDLTVNSLHDAADGPGILDRIVLTGQTCRLGRVREVVKEVFQNECDSSIARLRWDPTCLTFEGDYAKQAAALGAAYAQLLREDRVPPSVDHALNGNVLDVDIQNLFFFLQSGFYVRRATTTGKQTVLVPGQSFREFDADGIGHLRSDWVIEPTEMLYVDRFDFASDAGVPWGHYDCQMLVDQLGVTLKQFQEQVRIAIEADHRLLVSVLFCWGPERHYELPVTGEKIDLIEVLQQLRVIVPPAPQADPAGGPAATPPLTDDWMQPLSEWVVGVNVNGGFRNENLFRLSPNEFNKTLRHPTDNTKFRGVESVELPPCPESGTDKFYVRPNDPGREWIQIGQINRPMAAGGRHVATRAVLDSLGHLRVILGELPLYLASADKDLLDPGVVLRKSLTSSARPPEDLRDPFCGKH